MDKCDTQRKSSPEAAVILVALVAALVDASAAAAQQQLPLIVVEEARKTVKHKPALAPRVLHAARPVVTASRPPRSSQGGGQTSAPSPTPFVPVGEQLGLGPSGVVGYVARGTSTATKTNTPILDIPQSITILTQQQLQDRNSQSLEQALSYVPGVTVAGGEGNADQVAIRGQTTTADFYKDGIRDDAEYIRDLYNIQSVEVLKGPSAVAFGRGNVGGIINRVTKKADGETIRDLQTTFGSFGKKRVTIDLGEAVSDQFAFRLNGLYEQSYGYRNYFGLEKYGISPTFTWKPDEKTLVTLTYEHFRDRRTADRGINSLGPSSFFDGASGSFASLFPGYPASVPSWAFYGDGNPSVAKVNYSKVDLNSVDLDIAHTTDSGVEIRNHTTFADYQKLYQNTFTDEPIQVTEGSVNGISGYQHYTPRQNLINQTNIIYKYQMTPEIRHTFLFGGEIGHQRSRSNLTYACFNDLSCMTSEVDTPFFAPTIYNPVAYADPQQRRQTNLLTLSGYVQDQIEITKYVDLIAGVRHDRFDLRFTGADLPIAAGSPASDPDEAAIQIDGNIHQLNARWSPRLGLVFKPTDRVSFYSSYSRSFLPAAGDQFVLLTPNLSALAPQGAENYEIGFKAQVLPLLYFTGALYELNRSNQPAAISSFYAVNVNTQTRGGELGLVGQVNDKWQVSLGYSHQISLVTSANAPPDPTDPLATYVGKKAPNVPLDTFSFWNKYDASSFFDATPGVLGVGAGVVYNAKFYPELNNAVIVPGYARVDGAVFLNLSKNVSARLNVENLAGAHYYVAASANNNIMPGAPRSVYVTLSAKF